MLINLNAGQPSPAQPAQAQPAQAQPAQAQPTQAENKTIIIEAGKGTKIVKTALTPEEKKKWEQEEQKKWDMQQQQLAPTTTDTGVPASTIDNTVTDTVDTDRDGVIDSMDVDNNANNIRDDQEQGQGQLGPQQQKMISYVSKEFSKFMQDTRGLVKELYGYAAKGGKGENYINQVMPVLQGFINEGGNLYGAQDFGQRHQILRSSLEKVISGLQGISPGGAGQESQMGDLDLGAGQAGAGQDLGAGQAGAGQDLGAGQAIPFKQQPNLVDMDKLDSYATTKDLFPIKQKIDARWNALKDSEAQQSQQVNVPASYNHKLKLVK